MLQSGNDLIDLSAINDENILKTESNLSKTNQKESKQAITDTLKDPNYTILSEEMEDVSNLPASPPFTKVSSIKMFQTGSKVSKNQPTPLRQKCAKVVKSERIDECSARPNKSKDNNPPSLLPRMKKRSR